MPKVPPPQGKKRLQFDFGEPMLAVLNKCKEKLGAGSKAETVRRALRLMELCLDGKLYVEGKDGVLRRTEII